MIQVIIESVHLRAQSGASSRLDGRLAAPCSTKELSKNNLDSSSLLGGSQARGLTADSPLLAALK